MHNLQVLRDTLRCKLPIEIVYDGQAEMTEQSWAAFEVLPALPALRNSPCRRAAQALPGKRMS